MTTRAVKNTDDLALLKVYLDQRKRPFTVEVDGRTARPSKPAEPQMYKEIANQTGEVVEEVRARCAGDRHSDLARRLRCVPRHL